MSKLRGLTLFSTLLLLNLLVSAQAWALNVQNVRFGVHPDKTRLVLDISEITDFRAFVLSSPNRLVIDLPSFNWQAGQVQQSPKAGVLAVRYGALRNGISRIVFDLSAPAAIQTAFALPQQASKPNRLVIDFNPVNAADFERTKSNVHGTLTVDQKRPHYNGTSFRTAGTAYAPPPGVKPAKKPLIIIDPGHGGVDPGAVGKGNVYEKHVVLGLANELKRQLESSGQYRVLMTRERDVFIKLADRVRFARKHGGDLFISIHADSIQKSHVHGASIYTLSEKASDAQTAKLAARENRADLIAGIDLSVEDEDVANILVDLAMRDTMNQSKFFANTLVDSFQSQNLHLLESPHRYAGFAVLKAPDIPSILVEAGFMSNRKEARLLSTASHQKRIATALKKGIDAYFTQVRKNQRI